jgi:hypothetical protein
MPFGFEESGNNSLTAVEIGKWKYQKKSDHELG